MVTSGLLISSLFPNLINLTNCVVAHCFGDNELEDKIKSEIFKDY